MISISCNNQWWIKTKIPFPFQLLSEVMTVDLLNPCGNNKLTNRLSTFVKTEKIKCKKNQEQGIVQLMAHTCMLYCKHTAHTKQRKYLNPGPSGLCISRLFDILQMTECMSMKEAEREGGKSERISFPPFEPGRAVSKKVLTDFEVVAVGNASHRLKHA